jgi:hypothetical protein
MYEGEFIVKAPFIEALKKRMGYWNYGIDDKLAGYNMNNMTFARGYHDALEDLIFDLEDGLSI